MQVCGGSNKRSGHWYIFCDKVCSLDADEFVNTHGYDCLSRELDSFILLTGTKIWVDMKLC